MKTQFVGEKSHWFRAVALALLVALGAGGGTTIAAPTSDSDAQGSEKSTTPSATDDRPGDVLTDIEGQDLERLKERVNARWNALLSRDYTAAYQFATPTYRSVFTERNYYSGVGEQVKRNGIEIFSVNYQDEARTKARVRVVILYTSEANGSLFNGRSGVWESWAKEDGQWWIVPD